MADYLAKIKAERQGERFVALGDIAVACGFTTPNQKELLGEALKELAAEYWLKKGGDPEAIYQKPKEVMQRSLSGDNMSDPAYSQAFVNDLINQGRLEVPGMLESPFFKLPEEQRSAVMDGLAKGEPLSAPDTKTGQVERLAIRAGIKDEILR